LLFEFGDSDENALKELFANFFPERVLFLVLNNAENHYVVVELKWFDSFVTVYDSARSVPKGNGSVNMRENCASFLNVPVLERIFRVLGLQPQERVWRFASDMPQQNNGRDCGIFAMEVARTRARAAMVKVAEEQKKADQLYQRLQANRTKNTEDGLPTSFA
jgi:Ulp1 family protease